MPQSIRLCAFSLLLLIPLCSAQTTTRKKTTPPKPEPTESDLVEYIRGALLSLSPGDGINDNLDVRALNPNNAVWDVFDPSDSERQREKLVRLTMVSVTGKTARTCYDKLDHVDTTLIGNRARFLFSQPKTDDVPDFQGKMTKALKKLIALTGGAEEKEIF